MSTKSETPSNTQSNEKFVTFKIDHAPAKHEKPENQRFGGMIRFFETKGLKTEQNFKNFLVTVRKIRKSSSTMIKASKKKSTDTQTLQSNASTPKVRKQDAEFEHLIVKNPHETDAQFTFTKNAKRAAQNATKQHMLQVISNIKYVAKNSDQVVKYLTGNPIIYSNITDRQINVVIREFPHKFITMGPNDLNLVEIRNKKSLSVVLVKTRDDGTTYLEDNPYNFQRVFEEGVPNTLLYAESVAPLVNLVLSDLNRCAMCVSYGQRRSGKTYSLFGATDTDQSPVYGVAQLAVKQLLEQGQKQVSVAISFYEIYLGRIYDLLNNGNDNMQLREEKDNIIIEGLSEQLIESFEDCCRLLKMGIELRNESLEYPNKEGSRSFLILLVKIKGSGLKGTHTDRSSAGQIAFVDMAAFEHSSETLHRERPIRMLAHEIKRTMHSLLICSRNIEESKRIPPFRESRITTALQGFFSSSCQMLLIGHMIPFESQEELLFQLLNYCNRIQKPPGEVLDLQSSKYSTFETRKNITQSNLPIKPLNYNIIADGISEYLIDNRTEKKLELNDLKRAKIASPEKRSIKLIEMIAKDPIRYHHFQPDAGHAEKIPQPLNDTEQPQFSPHSEHHKKKKGLRKIKDELRLRKQLELDHLLQVAESPQSRKNASLFADGNADYPTLSKKDVQKLPTSKFVGTIEKNNSSPSIHGSAKIKHNKRDIEAMISLQNDYYEQGVPAEPNNAEDEGEENDKSKTTKEIRPVSRADSDIGYRIIRAEKKSRKKLEEKQLSSSYGGKYNRAPDQNFYLMERFASKFTQHVSPSKARKEANKLKNEFYRSVAEQNLSLERSRTAENQFTKHEVFSSYMNLSKACASESTKNRRLRSAFGRQMGTIKSSYGKIGRKLETTEKEIERRLKADALEDYKNHIGRMPLRPKTSKGVK